MYEKKSTLLVALSAVLFATGGLFFKIIPWNPLAINSARTLIAGTILLCYSKAKGHKLRINKSVILAAAGLVVTNNLYAMANKLTTAGNTIILQFTMPIFVVLIMLVMYKQKPTKLELITCALVFAGIVIFFIDSISAGHVLGDVLAIISGVGYAFFFVFSAADDADSLSSILLAHCCSILIGMPALVQTDFKASGFATIAALLGLGILQQAMGQITFSEGIAKTPAVAASLISGIEPILNPILVAVFWHEMLSPLALCGGVLVLVSIMYYNYRRAKGE